MYESIVQRIFGEFRKSKLEFRSYDPSYQARVIKVRMICWGWLAFICTGAGIFLCSTPYMDRRREERGETLEFRSAPGSTTLFESFLARRRGKELESPEEFVESLKKKS